MIVPIEELELSVRSTNTLKLHGITNSDELEEFFTKKTKAEVLREIRYFGVRSYREVMDLIGHWNQVRRQNEAVAQDWREHLEPAAAVITDPHNALLVSIAISTKRIADALVSDKIKELYTELLFQSTNQYGEGLMEGIQGSIRRGQQGIE